MDFSLSDVQLAWQSKADSLGRDLPPTAASSDVIAAAARVGLIDPQIDLLTAALAIEALAGESAGAALALALHTSIVLSVAGNDRFTALTRGEVVAAVGLSSDDVASEDGGLLSGRASWVGPLTDRGLAVIGVRRSGGDAMRAAVAVSLDQPGVAIENVETAALSGFECGYVTLREVPFSEIGSPLPIMARIRILLAAAGLGMGRRALREALQVARTMSHRGAGGEQTVQGLMADGATELDAATMLTWRAASDSPPALASASMAKLAATEATQRAVARATQVVGADSFRAGHVVGRLAQDVRALELFAGRTEALREAVAEETLPRP